MKLHHAGIQVKDIEESKKFYKTNFGFESPFEKAIEGEQFDKIMGLQASRIKFAVLKMPDTEVVIEIMQFLQPEQSINPGFRHLAFTVKNPDEWYEKLKTNHVEIVAPPHTISQCDPKIDGKRMFYCKDPDGNIIEIFKPNENMYSEW